MMVVAVTVGGMVLVVVTEGVYGAGCGNDGGMVVVAVTVGGTVLIVVMAGVYGAGCGNDGVWWCEGELGWKNEEEEFSAFCRSG